MHIVFKFNYIHHNGLFNRLLKRISEKSPLSLTLSQENNSYMIEASAEQEELEALAELVSELIPKSLFLFEYSIEEIESIDESKSLDEEQSAYTVPYCPECQAHMMETLDPFIECSVCGFSEMELDFQDLLDFTKSEAKDAEELFTQLADTLISKGELSLCTYNGERRFALLSQEERAEDGIVICDPSEISTSFIITQDELDTLMMVEKPSLRLKPKVKIRAEYEFKKSFYPVFFADDKITLALSLALSRKGVLAVYCDKVSSLKVASALQEHVIINVGRDMLPWPHPTQLNQAAVCDFDDFTAFSNTKELVLDNSFEPSAPFVRFVPKNLSSSTKGIAFEPSHAALRSVVLEHDLQGKSLCGIYLSRTHDSQMCCFSTKIGYSELAGFSYEIDNDPVTMLESISQMDEEGARLIVNYKKAYPKLYEKIEQAEFNSNSQASMITRLWAMAALFIGLVEGGDIHHACEELEAAALEFHGKSGPRIDYKVMKDEEGYLIDPRLAIRSAMSFKLAGVDDYLLSFGFIDSLADFIAQQAEMADANIAIEGASVGGSLFENRQLLMRTYNALSPNYKVYRNRALAIDGANIAIGALTLGSE